MQQFMSTQIQDFQCCLGPLLDRQRLHVGEGSMPFLAVEFQWTLPNGRVDEFRIGAIQTDACLKMRRTSLSGTSLWCSLLLQRAWVCTHLDAPAKRALGSWPL